MLVEVFALGSLILSGAKAADQIAAKLVAIKVLGKKAQDLWEIEIPGKPEVVILDDHLANDLDGQDKEARERAIQIGRLVKARRNK